MTPEKLNEYLLYAVPNAIHEYRAETLSPLEEGILHPWECKLLDDLSRARRSK